MIRVRVTPKEAEAAEDFLPVLLEFLEEAVEAGEADPSELEAEMPSLRGNVLTLPGGYATDDLISRLKYADGRPAEELCRKIQYALGGAAEEYQRGCDAAHWEFSGGRRGKFVPARPEPRWRVE